MSSSSSSSLGWLGALSTVGVLGASYYYYQQAQIHDDMRYNGELDGPLLPINQAKNNHVLVKNDFYGDNVATPAANNIVYPTESVVTFVLPCSGVIEHPRTKERYRFVQQETHSPIHSLTALLKIDQYENRMSSLLQLKHVLLLHQQQHHHHQNKKKNLLTQPSRFYIHQDQVSTNVLSSENDHGISHMLFICKVEESSISSSSTSTFYLYIMFTCIYDPDSKRFKTQPHSVRLDADTDISFTGGLLNVHAGSYDVTQQQVRFPFSPRSRNEFWYENVIRLIRHDDDSSPPQHDSHDLLLSSTSLSTSVYTILQRPVLQNKRFGLPYVLSNIIPSRTTFTLYFPWWNASDHCSLIFETPLRVIDGNQVTSPVIDRSQSSIYYLQIEETDDEKSEPATLYNCHEQRFLNHTIRQFVLTANNATDYLFEFKLWLIKTSSADDVQHQQQHDDSNVINHHETPIMHYIIMIKQRPTIKTMMMATQHDRDFVYGEVYYEQILVKEVLQFQLNKQLYRYHVEINHITSDKPQIKLNLVS